MNFSLFLSVIVIFNLGSWATTKDVFLHFRKSSLEVSTEEIKRKQGGELGLPIIRSWAQMASKARSWMQWLRKLLKILKKWCHSHPSEVKLAKCFANYFNVNVPGIRNSGKSGESELTERPHKRSKVREIKRVAMNINDSNQKSLFRGYSFWYETVFSIHDFIRKMRNHILHYKSAIFSNELAVCLWEYLSKKFWMWIDSAPDSRGSMVSNKHFNM